MSDSVEDRIVAIKFDNAEFEQKIATTMASLDKFTQKLSGVSTANNGFKDIQSAADSVNLSNVANGISSISSKLSGLGAVGFSVIQQLTQNLLGFAGNFAKQDFLSPLISGGRTRALEIAQAQFQFQGLGLNVQEVMKNALDAVKGTAFGLGDAAKAAAQFGASGISAGQDMTESLRAIAGVAALTGTQFNDMAVLFTQSAATGKITNLDLQQFATRGFNAAAAFAKQTGQTEAAVHAQATAGTLDYKTFADAMFKAFGPFAVNANQTYTGSLDNMHAALARIGAAFIGPGLNQSRDLFNNITPVIDKLNTALQPLMFTLLANRGQAFNGIGNFFKNLDLSSLNFAIPNIATGLQNIFDFIRAIADVGKDAFKDIFPGQFSVTLVLITDKFRELTEKLRVGWPLLIKIHDIFAGLFSILDIGWAVIKGVATVIGDLLHALHPAGSGLLNMAASTGTFLQKLDLLLVKGGLIQEFFDKLGSILAVPIRLIGELAAKIAGFLTLGGHDVLSGTLDRIQSRLNVASGGADRVKSIWDKLIDAFKSVGHVLDGVFGAISNWFHELFHRIAQEMQPADFNSALDAVNVGLLGGITLMLKKFFAGGVKFGFGGGVFTSIKTSLNQVTRSLQLMQTNLKAAALEKIAISIAVLAAAVIALSLVNSSDLTKALVAMSVGFGQLAATLVALEKITGSANSAFKLDLVAGSLIALAAAMVIFALAVKEMSKLSLAELGKGLGGVAAGLAILVTGVNFISADTSGLVRAGIAMGIIAIALRILADAVKAFAGFSWSEMGRGLVGIAAGLTALTVALNFMPPESLLGGLGFIALAIGLRILADAVKAFGGMDIKELAKGLGAVIVGLAGIALAMNFMPADLPITAVGVGILAVALRVMAEAIKSLGGIPFGELAKGVGAIAAVLLILVVAVNAMDASITGAASIVVIAGALLILTDVIQKLGQIPLKELGIGLGAIAAVFLVLGVAAALLTPVIPSLLGLGIAMAVIGGAFVLFGAGAFLAVAALQVFAVTGVKSIAAFTQAIPALAAAGVALIINFANDLLVGLPTIIKTIKAILDQLLDTIIRESPKVGEAMQALFITAITMLQTDFPIMVQTGALMIQSMLQGIENNIGTFTQEAVGILQQFSQALIDNMGTIVSAGANVIVSFISELGNHEKDIILAGAGLIVDVITGIGQSAGEIVKAVADMIVIFLGELGNHTVEIIAAAANLVVTIVTGISSVQGQIITAVTNLIITFITEVGNHTLDIVAAGVNLVIKLLFGIAAQGVKMVDAAGQCILNFLDGLDQAVKKYEPQIIGKAIQIGFDIIAGIFTGIANAPAIKDISGWLFDLGSKVVGWVGGIAGWVAKIGDRIVHGIWDGISGATDWLGKQLGGFGHSILNFIGAPFGIHFSEPTESTVMRQMAVQVVKGFVTGISNSLATAEDSMSNLSNSLVTAFNPDTKNITESWANALNDLATMNEFNPTITPVLDLSKVQAGASDIASILGTSPLTTSVSAQQATSISASISDVATTTADKTATTPTTIEFNQTINAPTALSTNDIYRNTKSQITLAKEELNIS